MITQMYKLSNFIVRSLDVMYTYASNLVFELVLYSKRPLTT
jgi:hypothetical protein